MASIKQYNGSWRATVKRKGFKVLVSHHPTKKEAEEWAREKEINLRRQVKGMSPSIDVLAKYTVRHIVERYRDEKSKVKGCHRSETACLNKFLRESNLADRSLASLHKPDAYKYRDARLAQGYEGRQISYRTVVREFAVLRHIWETAKEEWGFPIDVNPWEKVKAPPGHKKSFRRKRRLRGDELIRILAACSTSSDLNWLIMSTAIRLTIETGLRLQEVMNLRWNDLDFNNRRIEIRKSKTDLRSEIEGRTIVMTLLAKHYLQLLMINIREHDVRNYMRKHKVAHIDAQSRSDPDRWLRPDGPVFPPTEEGKDRINAFKQLWKDIEMRAGIPGKNNAYTKNGKTIEPDGEGLTFHDLRHEAGSRFDAAGLTKGEHDLMMGHNNRDMASLYIHAELTTIQNKLDTYHIPQIKVDPLLSDEERDFIINGPPKDDGPETYFDVDGHEYILDKEGNRKYLDKEDEVTDMPIPDNVVKFSRQRRMTKGSLALPFHFRR